MKFVNFVRNLHKLSIFFPLKSSHKVENITSQQPLVPFDKQEQGLCVSHAVQDLGQKKIKPEQRGLRGDDREGTTLLRCQRVLINVRISFMVHVNGHHNKLP